MNRKQTALPTRTRRPLGSLERKLRPDPMITSPSIQGYKKGVLPLRPRGMGKSFTRFLRHLKSLERPYQLYNSRDARGVVPGLQRARTRST